MVTIVVLILGWGVLRKPGNQGLRVRIKSKAAATHLFQHEFEVELEVPGSNIPEMTESQVQAKPPPSEPPDGGSRDAESEEGGEGQ